jgi:hypothetical protein
MTDQRLHDLLYETVSDVSGPDLADAAWRSGVRARRRRTASLAAGAAAAVVAIAGAVALVDHGPSAHGPTTGPSSRTPSTSSTPHPRPVRPYVADPAADAHYAGVPVWWSPTLAQEQRLPTYPGNVLPATIDLDAPVSPLADHPIRRAVAAFASSGDGIPLGYVRVLAPDGRLLEVDTTPVKPMTDPEGNQRIRVGPSLLSRSGEYLMFPQDHSLLVYTLRTGQWRTIHTGKAPTWNATWIGNTRISLADPARPLAQAPEYSIDGTALGSGNVTGMGLLGVPLGSSQLYGRMRSGRDGNAQAFSAGAPIPEPQRGGTEPGGSDWIASGASQPSILLIPSEPGRQKQCCQVDGWIGPGTVMYDSSSSTGTRLVAWDVGTGRFWQVSRITGVDLGEETVAASYAQFAAARLPLPF